jgi:hypothetical protein
MLVMEGDMTGTRTIRVFFCALLFSFLAMALAAQPRAETSASPPRVSRTQRELGIVILEDFSVKDGVLSFTTPTGGCTDKASFKVSVKQESEVSEKVPHFALTIERIKIDECKAFFPDGEVIEYDLEKDLGIKGACTISISNPLAPKAGLML